MTMVRTVILLVFLCVSPVLTQINESHALFSALLKDYVNDGLVKYKMLCADKRLEEYITQLSLTNPDTISTQQAKLAFWLNVYNAYTLKIVCDNYPIESINDLHWGGLFLGTILGKTIWDKDLITINGTHLSLNTIEHEIIRPTFKEARIHFALVCASRGCPPLRNNAYEADSLEMQLDDQARLFLNDASKNNFDTTTHHATLSKVFSWYSEDFGDADEKILEYVAKYLPPEIGENIRRTLKDWDIDYGKYDWRLNEE
jgi:hypothetical protein